LQQIAEGSLIDGHFQQIGGVCAKLDLSTGNRGSLLVENVLDNGGEGSLNNGLTLSGVNGKNRAQLLSKRDDLSFSGVGSQELLRCGNDQLTDLAAGARSDFGANSELGSKGREKFDISTNLSRGNLVDQGIDHFGKVGVNEDLAHDRQGARQERANFLSLLDDLSLGGDGHEKDINISKEQLADITHSKNIDTSKKRNNKIIKREKEDMELLADGVRVLSVQKEPDELGTISLNHLSAHSTKSMRENVAGILKDREDLLLSSIALHPAFSNSHQEVADGTLIKVADFISSLGTKTEFLADCGRVIEL